MSTKVVPAPANHAKGPAHSEKAAKQTDAKQPVQEEEARLADDDSEDEVSVATAEAKGQETEAPASETSLAGDFSFDGALADAAASSGSLVLEADEADEEGDAQFGGGTGGTVLLVAAVALVGLGIAALVSGGDDEDDIVLNTDPTLTVSAATIMVDENSDGGSVTFTTADAEGDTVSVSSSDPSNGTVTIDGNTITYVPDDDFNGTDTFTITASDGNGGTATQTINVTVDSTNQAPIQGDGTTTTLVLMPGESGTAIVDFTDPDPNDTLTAETTDPSNGTVVQGDDPNTFIYTPNDGFTGDDSFDVTVTDGEDSVTYTVNVTVTDDATQTISIDGPAAGPALTVDVGDGAYILTDDITVRTDYIITGFGSDGNPGDATFDMDDIISVISDDLTVDDFNFGSAAGDANDLRITFSDGTNFSQIIINDVLADTDVVFDYDTAVDALGFDFMTFG